MEVGIKAVTLDHDLGDGGLSTAMRGDAPRPVTLQSPKPALGHTASDFLVSEKQTFN